MNKLVKIMSMSLFAVLALATLAFGQEPAGKTPAYIAFSGSFGAGLTIVGAAFGISRLAASAYESMARQPEVAGTINTAMIIAAALIEGVTLFALYICMISA